MGWTMATIRYHSCGTACKINFFRTSACCFERKMHSKWLKEVFLISCTLSSQQHRNEVWCPPLTFWTPGAASREENERLCVISALKSFCLHEREYLLRQESLFSLQRLLIFLLNCIQGFYCSRLSSRFFLPEAFPIQYVPHMSDATINFNKAH